MDAIDLDVLERETQRSTKTSGTLLLTNALVMAIRMLSGKALVWLVTIAAGGLWFLAMSDPSVLKIITASMFCLCVLVPILIRDSHGG